MLRLLNQTMVEQGSKDNPGVVRIASAQRHSSVDREVMARMQSQTAQHSLLSRRKALIGEFKSSHEATMPACYQNIPILQIRQLGEKMPRLPRRMTLKVLRNQPKSQWESPATADNGRYRTRITFDPAASDNLFHELHGIARVQRIEKDRARSIKHDPSSTGSDYHTSRRCRKKWNNLLGTFDIVQQNQRVRVSGLRSPKRGPFFNRVRYSLWLDTKRPQQSIQRSTGRQGRPITAICMEIKE